MATVVRRALVDDKTGGSYVVTVTGDDRSILIDNEASDEFAVGDIVKVEFRDGGAVGIVGRFR